jgi:hypothetical protein
MLAANVAVEQCRRLAAEGLTQAARLRAEPDRAAAGAAAPAGRGGAGPGGGMTERAGSDTAVTDFLDHARRRVLLLDGAMGSQIQAAT